MGLNLRCKFGLSVNILMSSKQFRKNENWCMPFKTSCWGKNSLKLFPGFIDESYHYNKISPVVTCVQSFVSFWGMFRPPNMRFLTETNTLNLQKQ